MNQPTASSLGASQGVIRIDAAAIVGSTGRSFAPASILLETTPQGAKVLAAGAPVDIDPHPANAHLSRRHHWPTRVILPGLVNAHAHLDLTHIGPQPFDPARGFIAWLDMVRTRRATTRDAIRAAVAQGVRLSLESGVVAVADIAGAVDAKPSLFAAEALAASPLWGASFLEFFALPRDAAPLRDRLDSLFNPLWTAIEANNSNQRGVRIGLQPHAPYSVAPDAYAWAARVAAHRNLPLATHLAESPDESRLLARGDGPFRDFLASLALWNDYAAASLVSHLSPIAHVLRATADHPLLAAHANVLTDDDIAILARSRTTIAYCPRASDYFNVPAAAGPHRYRDLLAAGVPVALGTDSIINLAPPSTPVPQDCARDPVAQASRLCKSDPVAQASRLCVELQANDPHSSPLESPRLGILEEMRLLHARDATRPATLLTMATTHGAIAIALDPTGFTLDDNTHPLGLIAIDVNPADLANLDPLSAVLRSTAPAHVVYIRPKHPQGQPA